MEGRKADACEPGLKSSDDIQKVGDARATTPRCTLSWVCEGGE
jgi:hypothetical protein